MQRALIYITPVAEREQVTTNGAPRLIIMRQFVIQNNKWLQGNHWEICFAVIPLSARIIFSQNSFASFVYELWKTQGLTHIYCIYMYVTINKMKCEN